ncbi:hypothetical protein [Aquimarina sp. RZ0]|uniref:hypothetical protein n=1 Tax=Aquimarina sp. RZ0 TaxID=2607730 RepID=UPI0011F17480|nr:hypothetical protein [Aquimarina sp. RZ0]KAA1248154.1 hypothetical protein F0000_00730 [Aquimarina sp. RZ0]
MKSKIHFIKIIILASFLVHYSCNGKVEKPCYTPDDITYTNQVSGLIEIHCFACHAPDVYKKKASRNKIFDYPSLKKMANSGQLIGSITHSQGYIAMPYRKGTKIDSCAIEVIKKWVKTGMKK